mmetsp:Transcript_14648/g.32116  ORF Transcript_14648/g.32116 Transcript_14648/m.32116 type:complete len:324 (-) Transcript_14648:49-1020(-)
MSCVGDWEAFTFAAASIKPVRVPQRVRGSAQTMSCKKSSGKDSPALLGAAASTKSPVGHLLMRWNCASAGSKNQSGRSTVTPVPAAAATCNCNRLLWETWSSPHIATTSPVADANSSRKLIGEAVVKSLSKGRSSSGASSAKAEAPGTMTSSSWPAGYFWRASCRSDSFTAVLPCELITMTVNVGHPPEGSSTSTSVTTLLKPLAATVMGLTTLPPRPSRPMDSRAGLCTSPAACLLAPAVGAAKAAATSLEAMPPPSPWVLPFMRLRLSARNGVVQQAATRTAADTAVDTETAANARRPLRRLNRGRPCARAAAIAEEEGGR